MICFLFEPWVKALEMFDPLIDFSIYIYMPDQ